MTVSATSDAAALRRQLGPTAGCVLECLRERSDDGRVVEASVRSIAADLGVAKNTAHRAIVALVRAGLIETHHRRDDQGRFRASRYLLQLHELTMTPAAARNTTRRSAQRVDDSQLSLVPGT